MLVIEQGSSILVYGQGGKLVYKSIKIVQYAKLSDRSLVVITNETVDFIRQVKVDDREDILVISDTKFESAIIRDDLIYIRKKLVVPILDIYDKDFNVIVRLYLNIKGEWVFKFTFMGIPYKSINPTHIDSGKFLIGKNKSRRLIVNLVNNKIIPGKLKVAAIKPLAKTLEQFKYKR